MSFNCPQFIEEVKEFVQNRGIKSVLEVGCFSGELKDALGAAGIDLDPRRPDVLKLDVREWLQEQPPRSKRYTLVFSSGLLEHYPREEAIDIIRAMAAGSNRYVLNYVPNRDCLAYMNRKASTIEAWKDERDYTVDELIEEHEAAGLLVVETGKAGAEWAKRFGPEPSEPYLLFCLAKIS